MNTAPRVLMVHQIDQRPGGAERYIELLAGGVRDGRVTLDVLVLGTAREAGAVASRLSEIANSASQAAGRPRPGAVWDRVKRLRPDILHWNFPDPFAFEGALLPSLPWGRPSVATDHLPMLRANAVREVTRCLANRRFARVIVVGQESEAAALAHWRRWAPRLVLVENGVPTGHGHLRRSVQDGAPLRLLFVGRLEPQKNPVFAIAVLDELAKGGVPATLTIVGDGSLRRVVERERRRRRTGHAST